MGTYCLHRACARLQVTEHARQQLGRLAQQLGDRVLGLLGQVVNAVVAGGQHVQASVVGCTQRGYRGAGEVDALACAQAADAHAAQSPLTELI